MSTLQTTAPLERLHLSSGNREAKALADQVAEGHMTLNAPYQRGSVWTLDQRIGLIRSWLQKLPIPAIIINDRLTERWANHNGEIQPEDPIYAVIDGKQRVETAGYWFAGAFAAPASWWAPELIETTENTEDGPYVRYPGLTVVGRRFFDRQSLLTVCEGSVASVREEAAIYALVNGQGTPMTEDDMQRAATIANHPR